MKAFKSQQSNTVVKRKAREFHQCFDCGKEITPNEEYYAINSKDEFGDYWHTIKICEECWRGRKLSAGNPKKYKNPD